MTTLLRRLAYWLRRHELDADLDEELESHRAMKQERLEQSGMAADDASYASRRALGNVTLAREEARSVWTWPWLDGVRQDAAYALRSLRRNPGFSAALILVSALGIGATTSVFGLVDGLVLKPLPVRDPERLVYLGSPSFSYPIFTDVRRRGADIFASVFAWNLESVNVDWNGQLEPAEVLTASGDFYSTLGIQAAVGRTFTAEDDRPGGGPGGLVAVISYACWERRFGSDRSVIGRIVRIDRQPFTIVGVAPRGFFGVAAGLGPDITIPLTSTQDERALTSTTSSWLHIMGRLRDGLSHQQANVALQQIWPAVLEVTTNPGMPADRRAKYLGQTDDARAGVGRLLSCQTTVRRTPADSVRAGRLAVCRGLCQRRQSAAGPRYGTPARNRDTAGDRRQPWAAGSTAVHRIPRLCYARRRPRSAVVASWAGGGLVAMMTSRESPIVLDVSPNLRVMLFAFTLTLVTVVVCSVLPALRATSLVPGATLKETGTLRTPPCDAGRPEECSSCRRWR